jgi:hypothetical protein
VLWHMRSSFVRHRSRSRYQFFVMLEGNSFTGCQLFEKNQLQEGVSTHIHDAGVIQLVIELPVDFTASASISHSSTIHSALLLLSSFFRTVSLLATHDLRLVNMKEDLPSGSPYRVSTRITARPLKARRPWSISLERGHRPVGWRSLLVLMIVFLVLGIVVAVPFVVSKLKSAPVSASGPALQTANSSLFASG